MIPRFKLIAAVLGFAVAAGAVADASAATIVKTHSVTHRAHPIIVGGRIVKQVRIVHRAPALVRRVAVRKVVRVTPLSRAPHVLARRVVTKTIVR